jgi:predicted metal-binding membrane protein
MLWHYREALAKTSCTRVGRLTALVGLGYFFVWTALGVAAYPLGIALAEVAMQLPALSRAVPTVSSVVVLIAGALQFSPWKAHHLGCCREVSLCGRSRDLDSSSAWRHGVRLGLHCVYCCSGLTAILLVLGVMDLPAMLVVTAANTAERLAPDGERAARAIGVVVVTAGLLLLGRSIRLAAVF